MSDELTQAQDEFDRTATTFLDGNYCTCRKGPKEEYEYNRGDRQDRCLWCVCYHLIEKLDRYHEWAKPTMQVKQTKETP